MGKPPCRTELGPPASCDQGAWRLRRGCIPVLHKFNGIETPLRGAQTQRLSKLAALCLASDGLHLESPALAEVCKLLSDAYLSCGQRGEASGCDAGHDAPGTNVGSVAARSSAHMEHSEKHR